MAEGVSEILEKLKLTSKEEEVIDIADDRRISEIESCVLSLVGKFLTCKPYNKRAALSTLRRVWGLGSELQIVKVGANLFQFKFKTEFQMARILKDGPWSFDNQLLFSRDGREGCLQPMLFLIMLLCGCKFVEHPLIWFLHK